MKDNIGSKMVQANPKIIEKVMKKRRGRKAESSMDKGDKKNNLTRAKSWDPMLAWSSPLGNLLVLDQAITDKLAQLILSCSRS